MVDLPSMGSHPVVVISSQRVIDAPLIKSVNALLCSSIRGSDQLGAEETYLDEADGLSGPTGCQCHAMLLIQKQRFISIQRLGTVTPHRREDIKRKLRGAFGI